MARPVGGAPARGWLAQMDKRFGDRERDPSPIGHAHALDPSSRIGGVHAYSTRQAPRLRTPGKRPYEGTVTLLAALHLAYSQEELWQGAAVLVDEQR